MNGHGPEHSDGSVTDICTDSSDSDLIELQDDGDYTVKPMPPELIKIMARCRPILPRQDDSKPAN